MSHQVVALGLACSILFSCKKDDHTEDLTNREPPKFEIFNLHPVVGSDIDSLEMKSVPTYNYEPGELPYAPKWETLWTCTSKPAVAAEPEILKKNELTAYATKLSAGDYRFEVSYRTKVSTRKAFIDVKVVQAKPPGTVIISDRVNWQLVEGGEFTSSGLVLYGTLPADPEIFYYSRKNKGRVIEYMDPFSNQWKRLAATSADTAFMSNGTVGFAGSNLVINVWSGITPDILPVITAKPPAVRITYP